MGLNSSKGEEDCEVVDFPVEQEGEEIEGQALANDGGVQVKGRPGAAPSEFQGLVEEKKDSKDDESEEEGKHEASSGTGGIGRIENPTEEPPDFPRHDFIHIWVDDFARFGIENEGEKENPLKHCECFNEARECEPAKAAFDG